MSHKALKVAAAKTSFPNVYIIDTICFDGCFLFHEITGRHYFLNKLIVTERFGEPFMMLCSMKQVFLKKSTFYIQEPKSSLETYSYLRAILKCS